MPSVSGDAIFFDLLTKMQRFTGIQPEAPPAVFAGELRPYQREGLGWLNFLRDFGFPGAVYPVNPRGAPVLIVHGGPGGGCNATMRRYHDPDRYRIILFDQRGCGWRVSTISSVIAQSNRLSRASTTARLSFSD